MASGIILTVDWTGNPTDEDIITAKREIDAYNAANGTSLEYNTGPELKTSAQVILDAQANRWWGQRIAHHSKAIIEEQEASKLQDLRVACSKKLQDGEDIDDLIAAIEAVGS